MDNLGEQRWPSKDPFFDALMQEFEGRKLFRGGWSSRTISQNAGNDCHPQSERCAKMRATVNWLKQYVDFNGLPENWPGRKVEGMQKQAGSLPSLARRSMVLP